MKRGFDCRNVEAGRVRSIPNNLRLLHDPTTSMPSGVRLMLSASKRPSGYAHVQMAEELTRSGVTVVTTSVVSTDTWEARYVDVELRNIELVGDFRDWPEWVNAKLDDVTNDVSWVVRAIVDVGGTERKILIACSFPGSSSAPIFEFSLNPPFELL